MWRLLVFHGLAIPALPAAFYGVPRLTPMSSRPSLHALHAWLLVRCTKAIFGIILYDFAFCASQPNGWRASQRVVNAGSAGERNEFR